MKCVIACQKGNSIYYFQRIGLFGFIEYAPKSEKEKAKVFDTKKAATQYIKENLGDPKNYIVQAI